SRFPHVVCRACVTAGGTCGSEGADSCARVSAYSRFHIERYDISCGGPFSEFVCNQAYPTATLLPEARGGFCRNVRGPALLNGDGIERGTDGGVELLKKLWADGLSASQIAAELGGITRNAVIGKVHRLGLSGRAKSPSSSAPRPRKP